MIYKRKYAFAGISKQRQATAALWIRLCTAEVGGSNPPGSTYYQAPLLLIDGFQVKRRQKKRVAETRSVNPSGYSFHNWYVHARSYSAHK
jgi:hypothetical protein